MATNTNTLTAVIPQLLAQGVVTLRQNCVMPRLVNNNYDYLAAFKGQAITIPIPSAVTATAVAPSAYYPAGTNLAPTNATITLDQWYEAAFTLSDKEIKECMDGFIPMQAAEAIKAIGNNVDQYIMSKYINVPYFTGTTGTTPFATTISEATSARKILNNNLAPLNDRRIVLNADAEANLLGLTIFNSASAVQAGMIEAELREGMLARKLGFDWFMSQNVKTHTNGTRTASTGVISTASTAIGATQTAIVTETGAANEGDTFTVAGDTQQYVCLTGCTSTLLKFSPAAKVAWTSASVITMAGAANSHAAINLAFHRDAFAFVSRPLTDSVELGGNMIESVVDPVSGIALRLEVTRGNKETRFSYDLLYGASCIRPELACRILG
jgi:hypothetical protein